MSERPPNAPALKKSRARSARRSNRNAVRTGIVFALVLGPAFMAAATARAAEYYVATTGNDSHAGTMAEPFATLQKAANVVAAGDTVWIRGGTYTIVTPATSGAGINITKSGTSDSNRIKFWAYPGEVPIFSFEKMVISTTGYTVGFAVSGSWLHFKGLEIRNVPMNTRSNTGFGVNDPAHDDIFELMNFHHNNGSGFFISHGGGGHLILNSDSHDNYDPTSSQGDGQNSDGFGAHYQEGGKVTTFRGCRAWWNSDDGWDLISQEYPVIIEQSWAFGNGYIESGSKRPADGNGNGFKAGSSKTGIRHIVRNNVAWGNAAAGFYANHSSGGNDWYNNTAYNNGTQFNLLASTWDASGNRTDGVTLTGARAHKMRNNIGFPNKNSYISGYGVDTASNTWDLSITPATADFASVSDAGFMGPRKDDGSLPNLDFMKLRAGSKMIDKGVDVGLAFVGSVPDLGAYEFGAVAGGATSTGGTASTGGVASTGGSAGSAGSAGAAASGGARTSGGTSNAGSTGGGMPSATGGSNAAGGTSSGGLINNSGGLSSNGGTLSAGSSGTPSAGTASSGTSSTGGSSATGGGTSALGGSTTNGGSVATGGAIDPITPPTDVSDSGSCSCSVPGGARSPYGASLELTAFGLALSLLRRKNRLTRRSR